MIDVAAIPPGTRLRTAGGVVAEVIGVVDGEWLRVRVLEMPGGKDGVGDEELCHATDIVAVE